MSHATRIVLSFLPVFHLGLGAANATPLATFATTQPAHDYINFPIENGVNYGIPHYVAGTLAIMDPVRRIFAMNTEYFYDHSLIAYYDFQYKFVHDNGVTVFDDNFFFPVYFEEYSDWVDLGYVPDGGLPYIESFDGNKIISDFNSTFHGLQDNAWTIFGFRASVRHIYQPVPEPGTLALVFAGIAGLAYSRRRVGFSNAIGRPKNGPEKAPGRVRRGPKCASLGGFSAQSGRLEAWGWRVGRSLKVHGSQDWPGLRGDPDIGHGLPTQRAAPPRLQGSRSPRR